MKQIILSDDCKLSKLGSKSNNRKKCRNWVNVSGKMMGKPNQNKNQPCAGGPSLCKWARKESESLFTNGMSTSTENPMDST